jgi:hypothetical protein
MVTAVDAISSTEPPAPSRESGFVLCEGFRMTAHRDDWAGAGAVVRKPPMKETAVRMELWVNLGDDGLREAAYRGG